MKIRIRPSFSVYILILAFLAGTNTCISVLTALAVHEASHAIVAKLVGEPIESVDLTPFGGIMRCKVGSSASKGVKGILLALAGPAGNYALIALTSAVNRVYSSVLWGDIVRANVSMMLLNLLPAFPFDGGMALFCLGYYLFDVSMLIGALCMMGMLVGFTLCVLACAGVIVYAKLNLSLIIVGVYVLCYARFCKGELLAQNVYVVMCEQMHKGQRPQKVLLYKACGEDALNSLIPYMCKANAVAFLVETDYGKTVLIGDTILTGEILKAPQEQINNLIEKIEKNQ